MEQARLPGARWAGQMAERKAAASAGEMAERMAAASAGEMAERMAAASAGPWVSQLSQPFHSWWGAQMAERIAEMTVGPWVVAYNWQHSLRQIDARDGPLAAPSALHSAGRRAAPKDP